jgi:hypothetical protein
LCVFALYVGVGVVVTAAPGRWVWFRSACGLFLVGRAFSRLAGDLAQGHLVPRHGMTWSGALVTSHVSYLLSGVLAMVGAFMLPNRWLGAIAAFAAFSWAWMWGCLIREWWRAPADSTRG